MEIQVVDVAVQGLGDLSECLVGAEGDEGGGWFHDERCARKSCRVGV